MSPPPTVTDAAALEVRLDLVARTAAYERVIRSVKTEVMSQEELAGWLLVGENKSRGVVKVIDGAEKAAGGCRSTPCLRRTGGPSACCSRPGPPPDGLSGGLAAVAGRRQGASPAGFVGSPVAERAGTPDAAAGLGL